MGLLECARQLAQRMEHLPDLGPVIPMRVRATVPILPLRLVIRHGKVSSWPGVRLSRSAGSG